MLHARQQSTPPHHRQLLRDSKQYHPLEFSTAKRKKGGAIGIDARSQPAVYMLYTTLNKLHFFLRLY